VWCFCPEVKDADFFLAVLVLQPYALLARVITSTVHTTTTTCTTTTAFVRSKLASCDPDLIHGGDRCDEQAIAEVNLVSVLVPSPSPAGRRR